MRSKGIEEIEEDLIENLYWEMDVDLKGNIEVI